MKKIILSVSLLNILNAEHLGIPLAPANFQDTKTVYYPNKPADQQPTNNPNVGDVEINKFYLDMGNGEIKGLQKRDKEIKHLLDKFDSVRINQSPLVKSILSQDEIAVHPYFTFTILLPAGSKISLAQGKSLDKISFNENIVLFDVNNDFDRGNLIILYTDKNNKNKILNILVRRFSVDEIQNQELNTVYTYIDQKILKDEEVLEAFYKQYGKNPDKKYNYLFIDDMVYKIIEDEINGNLYIQNKKYRIVVSRKEK